LRKVETVFFRRFALHDQLEPIKASDRLQRSTRSGRFGDMIQLLADELRIGGFQTVELDGITIRAVLVQLHTGLEVFQILAYALYLGIILFYFV